MGAGAFACLHTQMQMATPASPLEGVFSHMWVGLHHHVCLHSGGSSSWGSPTRDMGMGLPKAVAKLAHPNPNICISADTASPSNWSRRIQPWSSLHGVLLQAQQTSWGFSPSSQTRHLSTSRLLTACHYFNVCPVRWFWGANSSPWVSPSNSCSVWLLSIPSYFHTAQRAVSVPRCPDSGILTQEQQGIWCTRHSQRCTAPGAHCLLSKRKRRKLLSCYFGLPRALSAAACSSTRLLSQQTCGKHQKCQNCLLLCSRPTSDLFFSKLGSCRIRYSLQFSLSSPPEFIFGPRAQTHHPFTGWAHSTDTVIVSPCTPTFPPGCLEMCPIPLSTPKSSPYFARKGSCSRKWLLALGKKKKAAGRNGPSHSHHRQIQRRQRPNHKSGQSSASLRGQPCPRGMGRFVPLDETDPSHLHSTPAEAFPPPPRHNPSSATKRELRNPELELPWVIPELGPLAAGQAAAGPAQ